MLDSWISAIFCVGVPMHVDEGLPWVWWAVHVLCHAANNTAQGSAGLCRCSSEEAAASVQCHMGCGIWPLCVLLTQHGAASVVAMKI